MRTPEELEGLDALVIPGRRVHHHDARRRARGAGRAAARVRRERASRVLGTCAGLILLDRDHLGLLDVTARRNAFGRQLHSFEAELELAGLGALTGVFIRAPWVESRGDERGGAGGDGRPPGGGAPGEHPGRGVPPRAHRRPAACTAGSSRRTEDPPNERPARRGARPDPRPLLDAGEEGRRLRDPVHRPRPSRWCRRCTRRCCAPAGYPIIQIATTGAQAAFYELASRRAARLGLADREVGGRERRRADRDHGRRQLARALARRPERSRRAPRRRASR